MLFIESLISKNLQMNCGLTIVSIDLINMREGEREQEDCARVVWRRESARARPGRALSLSARYKPCQAQQSLYSTLQNRLWRDKADDLTVLED